ncbi:MAG: hypothetical protein RR090_06450 [Niameybacter sp.]|uniref:hypothetical protein n=1 Tax=Niameybacter sp. TaxID=2033640 RepID=UPI002FCAEDA0
MGMPQIPEGKNRPDFDETMIDLLESVALEEMALSHIVNAEGEKLQEVMRQYSETCIGFCQVQDACKSSQSMMQSVIMKEWLLLNKLNIIMDVKRSMEPYSQRTSSCSEKGCTCKWDENRICKGCKCCESCSTCTEECYQNFIRNRCNGRNFYEDNSRDGSLGTNNKAYDQNRYGNHYVEPTCRNNNYYEKGCTEGRDRSSSNGLRYDRWDDRK